MNFSLRKSPSFLQTRTTEPGNAKSSCNISAEAQMSRDNAVPWCPLFDLVIFLKTVTGCWFLDI